MATVLLKLEHVCAGGGHVTISLALNGTPKGEWELWADDLLADITDEEVEAFAKLLIRAHKVGRTKAEVRTDLQTGLTVEV
jgi:hypothetical protein